MSNTNELEVLRSELRALQGQVATLQQQRRHRRHGVVLVIALLSTVASAQLIPFQADTPALATELNSNFTTLNTRITTEINLLRSQLEAKVGTATVGSITVGSGLSMNNLRITNAAAPAAGLAGNNDVVTKAHLKAIFANAVVYVTGSTCPPGFTAYATAEGRFIRGAANGDEGVGGVDGQGVAFSTANIAAANGGLGGPFVTAVTVGGQGNGGSFSTVPGHVRLKPCVFNAAY